MKKIGKKQNGINILVLCFGVFSLFVIPETKRHPLEKQDNGESNIINPETTNKGPEIVELPQRMASERPSYSYESSYKIFIRGDDRWGYMLPGGSIGIHNFETEAEVRNWIKRIAEDSYNRWILTNGLDF